MNHLPRDELFSAYLDGELTAAERAEMERLLATNPDARQLLDELRAVSGAIQALPREKLGEDLSARVLRVAERRMLTEGERGEVENRPVPLGRAVFRRLFNRRAVAWAGLAVAIAVMIAINERRQGDWPVVGGGKEVVLARSEKPANTPSELPTMQAAPETKAEPKKAAESLVERKSAAKAAAPREEFAPAAAAPTAVPGGMATPAATREKDKAIASEANDQGVLIVHCDISSEAAKRRAFDRLLVSNGIAWQQEDESPVAEVVQQRVQEIADQRPAREEAVEEETDTSEMDFVYVEAPPAQIAATLDSLRSQPGVFSNVSVAPVLGGPSQTALFPLRQGGQAERRAGGDVGRAVQTPTLGFEFSAAQGNAQRIRLPSSALGGARRGRTLGAAAVPESAAMDAEGYSETAGQRQQRSRLQLQDSFQSASRQQVLFVLRVVGSDSATTQTKTADAGESDATKSAAQPARKQP